MLRAGRWRFGIVNRVAELNGRWGVNRRRWRLAMTLKIFIAAFAMVLGATTVSLAQSMPNYGPNAPSTGDSFGKPVSGTFAPRSGYRAYAYQRRLHTWHRRHWHHQRPYD